LFNLLTGRFPYNFGRIGRPRTKADLSRPAHTHTHTHTHTPSHSPLPLPRGASEQKRAEKSPPNGPHRGDRASQLALLLTKALRWGRGGGAVRFCANPNPTVLTPAPLCRVTDDDARDLIESLLASNPADRPSAAEVLEHPFLLNCYEYDYYVYNYCSYRMLQGAQRCPKLPPTYR